MEFRVTHYEIAQIKPGMVLGKPVLNRLGRILLPEGTELNSTLITRLAAHDINAVGIREKTLYKDGRILLEESGVFDYLGAVGEVRNLIKVIRRFGKIPVKQFEEIVDNRILPIVGSYSAINYLNLDRSREEYIFHHSVNVALLSGIIGKWLGYGEREIAHLAMAGLLHDIGKTQMPEAILNKAGKLTPQEMQIAQLHSTHSYNLLIKNADLPTDVLFGILQHHERLDGSGYPGRFQQSKIHQHARIIAVADVYDAITADRAYSDKSTPFVAAEVLASNMYSKLDATVCTIFLSQFKDFVLGNLVELENGQYGKIIYLGSYSNASPLIRCDSGKLIQLRDFKQISKMRPFIVPDVKNGEETD